MRKADLEDIPRIRDLAQLAFRATYRDILSPQQLEYMMEMMYSAESLRRQMTEEHNTFFIEEGKGYVSFRPDGNVGPVAVYHLEKLYVLPEWQKTGLGRRLFNHIVEEVRRAADGKPARLELNVNRRNPALEFYEHIGMRRDRQGDFPIGNGYYMNDYIMALDL